MVGQGEAQMCLTCHWFPSGLLVSHVYWTFKGLSIGPIWMAILCQCSATFKIKFQTNFNKNLFSSNLLFRLVIVVGLCYLVEPRMLQTLGCSWALPTIKKYILIYLVKHNFGVFQHLGEQDWWIPASRIKRGCWIISLDFLFNIFSSHSFLNLFSLSLSNTKFIINKRFYTMN